MGRTPPQSMKRGMRGVGYLRCLETPQPVGPWPGYANRFRRFLRVWPKGPRGTHPANAVGVLLPYRRLIRTRPTARLLVLLPFSRLLLGSYCRSVGLNKRMRGSNAAHHGFPLGVVTYNALVSACDGAMLRTTVLCQTWSPTTR